MSAERRGPRRLGDSLAGFVADRAPQTLLADVQTVWPQVCGEVISANAEPVSEHGGRVTIACSSGAWAQELELMGDALRDRLRTALGAESAPDLRFTADLQARR